MHAYLDNGRAFASKWLSGGAKTRFRFKIKEEYPTGIMTALGIEIHWCRPYRGQSKPIERFFREICEYVSKHPQCSGGYRKAYQYYNSRWPGQDFPIGFSFDEDPNDYTIDVELLGAGAGPFPVAQMGGLADLCRDLVKRHDMGDFDHPILLGHEDVNPLARWGWDPGPYFDWGRLTNSVFELDGQSQDYADHCARVVVPALRTLYDNAGKLGLSGDDKDRYTRALNGANRILVENGLKS